jgi:hypothetical protein
LKKGKFYNTRKNKTAKSMCPILSHDTSNLGVYLYIETIIQIGMEWEMSAIEKEP